MAIQLLQSGLYKVSTPLTSKCIELTWLSVLKNIKKDYQFITALMNDTDSEHHLLQ